MARIAPLRGVFYNQKKIKDLSKVIAPPYDVISPEEQEKLYRKSPYNFVRLDLSQEAGSYDAIAQLFREWQAHGVFERDAGAAIYFSRHRFTLKTGEKKIRCGFFALTELENFAGGTIRPHERTLDAPKEDRLRLMLAMNALQYVQLGSLFHGTGLVGTEWLAASFAAIGSHGFRVTRPAQSASLRGSALPTGNVPKYSPLASAVDRFE